MKAQRALLILALLFLLSGVVWMVITFSHQGQQQVRFSFPDLEQQNRSSEEWRGKVLVVNFWATWCPPCHEEMPHFIEFQERYRDRGLQIVAIAIDDPEQVRETAPLYNFNFPVLLGGTEAINLSRGWGNRHLGLPFTAIFDRDGTLRYAQGGAMTPALLEAQLQPLL